MVDYNMLPGINTFESCLCKLTHQLLNNMQINQMTYTVLSLFTNLQLICLLMRPEYIFNWSFTVVGYLPLVAKYISFDSLLKMFPSLFLPLLCLITVMIFLTVLLATCIAANLFLSTRRSSAVQLLLPFLNMLLYLFKTLLTLPCFTIIAIGLSSSARDYIKIPLTSPIIIIFLSVFNLLGITIIQLYLIICYH